MATLTAEQAAVYQSYLRGYAMAAGAPVMQILSCVEGEPQPAETPRTVEQDIATALGACDGKGGASPRWSGVLLANVRHMKDPALGAGGNVSVSG